MVSKLYDTTTAAEILGISKRTLETWRVRGGGPRYVSLGVGARGAVRYREDDLAAYIAGRLRESTSAMASE
ncbi:MAG: helix-turn-helix domain-containing protein [Myxococcota bacterium]|nr:helix-turn-helix domain-containing protein [Myxococcota bacterium]